MLLLHLEYHVVQVLIEEFVGHVRGIADAVKTVSVESAAGPADRPKPAAASDWLDVEEEPVRSSAGADAKAAASIDADVFTTALRLLGIADRLTRLLGDVEDRLRAGCSIAVDLLPTALVVASDWQSSLEDADSVFAGPSGAEVGSEVTDASEAANDASSLPLACAGVALTYDAAKVDALRRLASDGAQGLTSLAHPFRACTSIALLCAFR